MYYKVDNNNKIIAVSRSNINESGWVRTEKEIVWSYINNCFLFADEIDTQSEEAARIEQEKNIKSQAMLLESINRLKQNLFDTDYIGIKIAEGVATKADYCELLAKREMWRSEINELQKRLQNY